jgi:hypothetical protein
LTYSHAGIPLITQSDPGTENVNVAYAQTALRHLMEPSLDGTIQHRWYRKHGNIKPEIHWSVFRKDWSVGFQALLDRGVDEGFYDIGDPLEWYVCPTSSLQSANDFQSSVPIYIYSLHSAGS